MNGMDIQTRVYSGTVSPSTASPAARRLVSPMSAALALATPAVTVPMLLLARHWSEHGARHSIGDMVPLAIGTAVSLAGARFTDGDPVMSGTCVALAGSCVALGAMSYPTGLAEPLIATVMATVTGWVFTRRTYRTFRAVKAEHAQRQADRNHQRDMAILNAQTALGVATIRGESDVQVARVNAAAALGVADRNASAAGFHADQLEAAWAHRRALDAVPSTERQTPALSDDPLAPKAASDVLEDLLGPVPGIREGQRV